MTTLLALLLPWLAGLTLHPATGPAVHVPLPRDHAATVKLLGPAAGGGWVLADERGDRKVVLLLRGHRLTTVRSVTDPQDGTSFRLSTDGTHVVEVDAPTTRRTDVWTFDLAGRDLRHLRRPGYLTLLGYDGTTVHLTTSRRTIAWRPGTAPVVIARAGGLAVDVPHDTLFTWDAGARDLRTDRALGAGGAGLVPALGRLLPADGLSRWRVRRGARAATPTTCRSASCPTARWSRTGSGTWPSSGRWSGRTRTTSCRCCAPARAGRLLRCGVGGDCTRISNLSGDPLSLPFQEVRS